MSPLAALSAPSNPVSPIAPCDAPERMQAALAAARVGLWEVDFQTAIVRWSDVQRELQGLPADAAVPDLAGRLALIHADDRVAVMATVHGATPQSPQVQFDFRLAAVPTAWRRATGVVTFDGGGTPLAAAGITTDVTGLKKLETELAQAQRLESVGRLAAGVAHDFNNLLTSILGFAEVVQETLPPNEQAFADLAEVLRAGRSAAMLTRRLLTFSRPRTATPQLMAVNAILASLGPILQRTIGETITLTMKLDPRVASILIDPSEFEQVIMNLVVNARDAMPAGGRLALETMVCTGAPGAARPVAAGECVCVTVSDTGVGMSRETQRQIFEPFFTTKPATQGTGLGLATAQDIVSRCGGTITVQSEVGTGTTFSLYLPRTDEAVLQEAEVSVVKDNAQASAAVLLVEDDDVLRSLLTRTLSARGYVVYACATAEAAISAVAERSPHLDILLADVVLPTMNGIDLARHLKRQHPHLVTLHMSGYSTDSLKHLGLLPADMTLMQKPFTPNALALRIAEKLAAACAGKPAHV